MTSSIEVLAPDGTLTIVYFPLPPKCQFLSHTTKEVFRGDCSIDDPSSKLIDLMRSVKKFEIEMDNDYEISKFSRSFSSLLSEDTFEKLVSFVWVLSLALNFFTIYGY